MGNRRTHEEQRDHVFILQNASRTVKPCPAAGSLNSDANDMTISESLDARMVGDKTDRLMCLEHTGH